MTGKPSGPPTTVDRLQRWLTPDGGASEVIGSILLVGITVVVTVAFVAIAFGSLGEDEPEPITELSHDVKSGDGAWGNGDEYVSVLHRGGEALAQNQFVVVVRVADGDEVRYAEGTANPVDHASQDVFSPSDDLFTIGERWRTPDLTIGEKTAVDVAAAGGGGGGHLLSSGIVRSGTSTVDPCHMDTAPPKVSTWTQSPPDVSTATSGPVEVTATLSDACSSVDTTVDPHLRYRVNDGTDPAFTDAGAMTFQSGTTWKGSIPDQSWSGQGGNVLEYKVTQMTDSAGNSGESLVEQDVIEDCSADGSPPSVASWSRSPSDVNTGTTGDVTVTATLTDDCAGVDTSVDPHLFYRVNDGSDPSFTDAGAMTLQSGTTWQGSVPDQTWIDEGGKTLEYKLVGMRDQAGDTGDSNVQSEMIETVTTYSYVQTPLAMITGTSSNDANARSADDSGAAATLTEDVTSSSSSTTNHYGSSAIGSAGTSSTAATGAPDDTRTVQDANGEFVEVSSFTSGTGSITKVEIAVEGHWTGTGNNPDRGTPDTVRLSHTEGSTSQTYGLQADTDVQRFLDVTADKASWTWTDIQNLGVRGTCVCHDHPQDTKVFRLDSLWVRVTATTPTYDLETDAWAFDQLGSGSSHTLETRYRTVGAETYNLQVWDGTDWNTRATLDQSTFTVSSYTLTPTEVSAGPQVRILDASTADSTEGQVDLDYVRVVNNP